MKTLNGYSSDEVISALQKDIRRGNLVQAMHWAYELLSTKDKKLRDKFWERMFVICAEDVSDKSAVTVINAFYEGYRFMNKPDKGDSVLLGMACVEHLAKAGKSRFVDDLYHCFKDNLIKKPSIPSYAIDKHTIAGKLLVRGDEHFYRIGSIVKNPKGYDKRFRYIIIRNIKHERKKP